MTNDIIRSARDILLEALYIKTEIDNLTDAGLIYISKKLRISNRAAAHMMIKLTGVTPAQLKQAQSLVFLSERQATGKLKSLSDLPHSLRLSDAIKQICKPCMDPMEAIRLAHPPEQHKAQTARLIAIARLQATPDYSIAQALIGHWRPSNATGHIHDMIELGVRSQYKSEDPMAPIVLITEEAGRFWEEPHHYIWIGQERARIRHTPPARRQRRAA